MSEATWSWILACFELGAVCGFWIVGHRIWWGWGVILLSSIAWLVYAITFNIPGFIVMSSIWGITHTTNMLRWLRDKRRL